MNERVYNRLANGLMLIGVASALLYDSGKLPRVLIASTGIIAGVAAIALYFWNQFKVQEKKKSPAQTQIEVVTEHILPEFAAQGINVALHNPAAELPTLSLSVHRALFHTATLRDYEKLWMLYDPDIQAIESYRKETAKRFLRNYAAHHARTLQWHIVKDQNLSLMKPEVELSPTEVAACAIEIIKNLPLLDDSKQWDYNFGPKEALNKLGCDDVVS